MISNERGKFISNSKCHRRKKTVWSCGPGREEEDPQPAVSTGKKKDLAGWGGGKRGDRKTPGAMRPHRFSPTRTAANKRKDAEPEKSESSFSFIGSSRREKMPAAKTKKTKYGIWGRGIKGGGDSWIA